MGQGKKLQTILKERNLSVTKLANETDISSNTLYAIIKRDSNINTETLNKISLALQISVDELSQLLTEDSPNSDSVQVTPYTLNAEMDETLTDVQELIKKLNRLSMEYQEEIHKLNGLIEKRERLILDRQRMSKEIEMLEYKITASNDIIENRKLELKLIRNKIL